MKSFATSIEINAPREKIWALLTDAAGYTAWNSTVTSVEGKIAAGETVKLHVKLNPGRAFPLKVTEFEPPARMVWRGGMPLGLFKGLRTFELKESGGTTTFSMREAFSGPLSPLIGRSIPDMQPAFADFAADLKKAAEQS